VLDDKNGFKEFKIGDSYSKWEKEVVFIGTSATGNKIYEYKGYCCQEVFGIGLNKITLVFVDNKLESINLETHTTKNTSKSWLSDEYKWLKINFEELLEVDSQEFWSDDNSGTVTSFWRGYKLNLMMKYEYMGSKYFDGEWVGTGKVVIFIYPISEPEKDGF
jgi:hypothetical protein